MTYQVPCNQQIKLSQKCYTINQIFRSICKIQLHVRHFKRQSPFLNLVPQKTTYALIWNSLELIIFYTVIQNFSELYFYDIYRIHFSFQK